MHASTYRLLLVARLICSSKAEPAELDHHPIMMEEGGSCLLAAMAGFWVCDSGLPRLAEKSRHAGAEVVDVSRGSANECI